MTTYLADEQRHRGECTLPTTPDGAPRAGLFRLAVFEASSGATIDERAVVVDACPASFDRSDDGDACTCAPGETLSGGACAPCAKGRAKGAPGVAACGACDAGYFAAAGAPTCSPCSAGTYSRAEADACLPCSAGTASSAAAAACVPCTPGTFAPEAAAVCARCVPGKFSGAKAAACSRCARHEMSNGSAAACTPCDTDAGETSNRANTACSFCLPSFFHLPSTGACAPCPDGARCTNTDTTAPTMRVRAGYWRACEQCVDVLPCPDPEACVGNSTCREGHHGASPSRRVGSVA